MNENQKKELQAALRGDLSHVKQVYVLEDGTWHINEPKKYKEVLTAEKILGKQNKEEAK